MSALKIRPANLADKPALGRLGALLVEEHFEFDRQRFLAPQPDMAERYGEFLIGHASAGEKFVLVAEQEREVAGYVFAGVEGADYMALRGPAGAVYDLVVDPNRRRQRIGSQLLDAALDELRRRGAPRAVLFTAEKNHAAQSLFSQEQFRRTMIEMTREL